MVYTHPDYFTLYGMNFQSEGKILLFTFWWLLGESTKSFATHLKDVVPEGQGTSSAKGKDLHTYFTQVVEDETQVDDLWKI